MFSHHIITAFIGASGGGVGILLIVFGIAILISIVVVITSIIYAHLPNKVSNQEAPLYATFRERFSAACIDCFILTLCTTLLNSLLNFFTSELMNMDLMEHCIWILSSWVYVATFESSKQQATLGKLLLKIKVSDLKGYQISFVKASVRYFSKWISSLIFFIGYFMMLWTGEKQTLHDKIARCIVTR